MKPNFVSKILKISTGFVALTAISGGIAILTGLDEFPIAWLEGTPFTDYNVPAIILTGVVGGSSLLATIMLFVKEEIGIILSIAAALDLCGFVMVEIQILKQQPPGPTATEIFYLLLGATICILGVMLFIKKKQHAANQS